MTMEVVRNEIFTTAEGSAEALHSNLKRKSIFITNITGATKTICKGDVQGVANAGIVIQANATWFDSDSEGYSCWKGAIQIVDSGAGSIAISETTVY
jgi:hypothetical protein